VNGKKIFDAMAIYESGTAQPDKPLTLAIRRGNETLTREFSPLGAVVLSVSKDSPAEQAGLKAGDLVTGIEGISMPNSIALSEYVHRHNGTDITLTVVRDKRNLEIKVQPRIPEGGTRPYIGVGWANDDGWKFTAVTRIIHPGPVEQIYSSVMSIVNTVEAVTARKSGLGVQHLGGPVMMMRIYYFMFESPDGWRMALWFSVVLNVNLALLNLLPIPVLDGGHITFALIEAATRKPVNYKVLEAVNTAAALLVIGFMLFVTFFDVQDLFGGKSPSLKFKPKPAIEEGK
jgi:regulator of sigma E protease